MDSLLESQNPDGGWPYQPGGPSWTEPTAYALLALRKQGSVVEPLQRGFRWLNAAQLPDGGWAPLPCVRQSSWVTAVVALLGPEGLSREPHRRGIAWIVESTGKDTNMLSRVRQFLTGGKQEDPGWPWFPGTSAWVTPTALSMLALRCATRRGGSAQIRERLDMGASYLLTHVCSDGGWNHGASRTLDFDARSYPETTGVALLALSGRQTPAIRNACRWAQAQLPGCRTSEAESWLRLGLSAHGQLPADLSQPTRQPRTIQNIALALLASDAHGNNPFLE